MLRCARLILEWLQYFVQWDVIFLYDVEMCLSDPGVVVVFCTVGYYCSVLCWDMLVLSWSGCSILYSRLLLFCIMLGCARLVVVFCTSGGYCFVLC